MVVKLSWSPSCHGRDAVIAQNIKVQYLDATGHPETEKTTYKIKSETCIFVERSQGVQRSDWYQHVKWMYPDAKDKPNNARQRTTTTTRRCQANRRAVEHKHPRRPGNKSPPTQKLKAGPSKQTSDGTQAPTQTTNPKQPNKNINNTYSHLTIPPMTLPHIRLVELRIHHGFVARSIVEGCSDHDLHRLTNDTPLPQPRRTRPTLHDANADTDTYTNTWTQTRAETQTQTQAHTLACTHKQINARTCASVATHPHEYSHGGKHACTHTHARKHTHAQKHTSTGGATRSA